MTDTVKTSTTDEQSENGQRETPSLRPEIVRLVVATLTVEQAVSDAVHELREAAKDVPDPYSLTDRNLTIIRHLAAGISDPASDLRLGLPARELESVMEREDYWTEEEWTEKDEKYWAGRPDCTVDGRPWPSSE